MTYDQWKTSDPNDTGFYDMPEDDGPTELDLAYAEIERLQGAKRRALAIADERSKENVLLRDALKNLTDAPSDEDWKTAVSCAQSCFPPGKITPEELDNAMQHAFGILSLRRSRHPVGIQKEEKSNGDI